VENGTLVSHSKVKEAFCFWYPVGCGSSRIEVSNRFIGNVYALVNIAVKEKALPPDGEDLSH